MAQVTWLLLPAGPDASPDDAGAIRLTGAQMVVGRSRTADVTLDDGTISSRHVRLDALPAGGWERHRPRLDQRHPPQRHRGSPPPPCCARATSWASAALLWRVEQPLSRGADGPRPAAREFGRTGPGWHDWRCMASSTSVYSTPVQGRRRAIVTLAVGAFVLAYSRLRRAARTRSSSPATPTSSRADPAAQRAGAPAVVGRHRPGVRLDGRADRQRRRDPRGPAAGHRRAGPHPVHARARAWRSRSSGPASTRSPPWCGPGPEPGGRPERSPGRSRSSSLGAATAGQLAGVEQVLEAGLVEDGDAQAPRPW